MGRHVVRTLILAALPASLWAQTDSALAPAAASITAADIAQYISALGADSLRARATPSRALERTAQYVVAQFQQLGLQPGLQRAIDQVARFETVFGLEQFKSEAAMRLWQDTTPTWWERYPLPDSARWITRTHG